MYSVTRSLKLLLEFYSCLLFPEKGTFLATSRTTLKEGLTILVETLLLETLQYPRYVITREEYSNVTGVLRH